MEEGLRGRKRKLSEDEGEERLDGFFRRRKKKRLSRLECWTGEERHACKAMQDLWMMTSTGDLCDVKIEVGMKREIVFCHKNVLVISSDYFKKMFGDKYRENVGQMSSISIDKDGKDEFSKEVVESVVRFIYLGSLSQHSSVTLLVPDIYMLAHIWLLHDLEDICVSRMMKDVGVKNFHQLLRFADRFSILDLKEVVKGFIARSLPHIFESSEFASLLETDIEEMLISSFSYCHQNHIWIEAVKRWCGEASEKFVKMVKKARSDLMSKSQIEDLVHHEDIRSHKELKHMFENKLVTDDHPTYTRYFPYMKSHSSITQSLTFGMIIAFRKNDIIVKQITVNQEVVDKNENNTSLEQATKVKEVVSSDLVLESQICYKNNIITLVKLDCSETGTEDTIQHTLPLLVYSLVQGSFNLIPFDIRNILHSWRNLYSNDENINKLTLVSSIYVESGMLYYLISNDMRIALVKLSLEDYFGKNTTEWREVFDLELSDEYFRFSAMVKVGIILIKPFEILLHISKSSIYGNDAYAIERIKLPRAAVQDPGDHIEMETVTEIPMKENWGIDPSTDFDTMQEFLYNDKKETIFVSHNNSNPMGRINKYSDIILNFELTLNEWAPLPKMKIKKSFCSLSLHGNRLFALGTNESNHLCCEAFNLDSEAWETMSILDNKMRIVELELQFIEVKSNGFPINHTLLDGQHDQDSDADSDLDCSDTVDSLELSFRTAQYGEELEVEKSKIEYPLTLTQAEKRIKSKCERLFRLKN